MTMRYEIMGPLQVVDDGKYVIRARKVEALLTVLLIRADEVVPINRLMTEIWGENPPRRAVAGIHVYISQIRKFLNGLSKGDESPVQTRPPGYMLRLGSDGLDFRDFERLVNRGRDHARAGRHVRAAADFENALSLWRGPLLDEACVGPIVEGFQAWLKEVRLECVEMMIDSRLTLARHRELIGDLYLLTQEHPLRETFYRQLMLALYRSGRQADALAVYQTARGTLTQELGLEPCPALQDLHQAILTSDRRLDLELGVA
ncbi:BTAD domain-containing putative transcriptional regulator [Actinomadura sp. 9N215]|uniref:AfsR/SARP family transcriptional regulator n=1 Tax=Actinomadura sp. 9N215 TaxID=3375150 RepID=UPI0037AFBAC6